MIRQADHFCEQLTKNNSSTFYKVFKVLKKQDQQAIYAIYAFCRICDDIVDDQNTTMQAKEEELKKLENNLELVASKQYQGDSLVMIALQDKFNKYKLNLKGFKLLIEGQRQDLFKNSYQTLDELEQYCYLVASSVGLMINPILAPQKYQELEEAAKIIGYALQLTNVLRDVGEDYAKYKRVYLPQEITNKYQLKAENLTQNSNQFKQVFEELAKITENYYTESKQYLAKYPLRSQFVIRLMLGKYRKIIQLIRNNNYDVFSKFNQYGDGIDEEAPNN